MPQGFSFEGWTTEDILNVSESAFENLSESQLRQAVGKMRSTINKRLSRLEGKSNIASPSAFKLEQSGGKLTTKGKSVDELKTEYLRGKQFLQDKTSTVAGYKSFLEDMTDRLEGIRNKTGLDIDEDKASDFFEAFQKLYDLDSRAADKRIKYDLWRDIKEEMKDPTKSPEEIAISLQNRITEIYEEQQGISDDFETSVSEFFE